MNKFFDYCKKHSWVLCIIVLIILIPQTIGFQNKVDGRIIITAIGIDRLDKENLEITAQVTLPKSGGGPGEVTLDFVSVKARSVFDGIQQLSIKIGKTPGLGHVSCIMLGDSTFNDDLGNLVDFALRQDYIDSIVMMLLVDGSAKDQLKKTKEIDPKMAISLRSTYYSKQEAGSGVMTDVSKFVSDSFNPSKNAMISFFKVEEDKENAAGSSGDGGESGGGSGGGGGGGGGSGGGSGGESSPSPGRIEYIGDIGLFKERKYIGKLTTDEEKRGYFFVCEDTNHVVRDFTHINTDTMDDVTMAIRSNDKKSKTKVSFKNGKPVVDFNIKMKSNIVMEIAANGIGIDMFSMEKNYLSEVVVSQIKQQIENDIRKYFNKTKDYQVDAVGAATYLFRHSNKEYKEYMKTHSLEDLISELEIGKIEIIINTPSL